MARLKRVSRWLILVIAGVAALAGGIYVVRHVGPFKAAAPKPVARAEPKVIPVTVELVTARPVRRMVSVVGSLYGLEEIDVTSKVEGRVLAIHHDVGDIVRPGEPLLEIDPVDHHLAADEMKKALDLELAKLGLKELPPEGFDVGTLPTVVRAVAQEQNAQFRLERNRQLAGRRAITGEDRDQAEMDHAVAAANLQQAKLDTQATLAAARHRHAGWQMALQRLRDTKVVVPTGTLARTKSPHANGGNLEYVIAQRSIAEGEMVRTFGFQAAGTLLFKLVIDRPLKLKATVPERHRAEIKLGQDAEVAIEAYPGRQFLGKVSRISPAVDRANRTFEVDVELPNQARELAAGSFAKASILVLMDPDAKTIPEEALISYAGVTKVFVVRDGFAKEVLVTVGELLPATNGNKRSWMEVTGDLHADDKVVTSGHVQLADGMTVRIK